MTSSDGLAPAPPPTCTVLAGTGTGTSTGTSERGEQSTTFPVGVGLPVLHAMIRAAQRCIPVGCRGGGCGACRVRVLAGTYATRRMSRRHVSPVDEADQIVLACRLLPSSDIVVERAPAPASSRYQAHSSLILPNPTPLFLTHHKERTMAVTGVLRPGFIQIRVLDMAEALVHYRDRLGLHEVSTGADGRVYLKGFDEFDRHSVVLREADEAGMDVMGFKVLDEATLIDFTRKLDTANVAVDHVDAGEQPGLGRRVGFTIPSGHRIELYAQMELSDNGPETFNPNVWPAEPKGMAATRFDHALLYGPRIAEVTDLFCDVLGFRLAEKVDLGPGGLAVWLTCSNKAHDIAFVENPEPGRFHHAAFFLETVNAVLHAGDIMAYHDIPIDIGPTRHGITRGYTIYFFDPSGNRNEVFAGGYSHYPDNPTREWTPDQLGKGIFYYERELNEAFLSVYT